MIVHSFGEGTLTVLLQLNLFQSVTILLCYHNLFSCAPTYQPSYKRKRAPATGSPFDICGFWVSSCFSTQTPSVSMRSSTFRDSSTLSSWLELELVVSWV